MTVSKRVTDDHRAEAKRLRKEGLSYREIGRILGFTGAAIHKACDLHYAEKRRAQINSARAVRKADGPGRGNGIHYATAASVRADAASRLAEIPPDTRDLTGIMFGDPIPNDPRRYWLHGSSTTTGEAR